MRFQRIIQTLSLATFLGLLLYAAHPYPDGLVTDFFLRLDPLIAVGTMVTVRGVLTDLLPAVVVILCALLVGRIFCGHICPMGTTIDLGESVLLSRKKAPSKASSYEATSRYRPLKYLLLAIILGAATLSVSLVYLASPISLITRLYGLSLYGAACLGADAALEAVAPLLSALGLRELAYLQVPQRAFAANLFVVALFAGILLAALVQPRFWCRNLCPAGAILAIFSRRPLIRRHVGESCTACRRCIRECPTGAIGDDPCTTVHSECIVCLRCQEICPENAISFFGARTGEKNLKPENPGRRAVVIAAGTGLLAGAMVRTGFGNTRRGNREHSYTGPTLIRPPGTMPEADFLSLCVRCGECVKACPTNTLQPVWLEAGLDGIFTPKLHTRWAACAVQCHACGEVCPTNAIRRLPLVEKNHAKIGTAWIVRQNCLVWEQDKKCLVCDEVCPYNAVSFQAVPDHKNAVPFVVENRCIGCGWCESKCPVQGSAAIRVNVIGEIRLASGSYRERAKEFGLVFRTKDNRIDKLAPGTFDNQSVSPAPKQDTGRPAEEKPNGGLPPGFIAE